MEAAAAELPQMVQKHLAQAVLTIVATVVRVPAIGVAQVVVTKTVVMHVVAVVVLLAQLDVNHLVVVSQVLPYLNL